MSVPPGKCEDSKIRDSIVLGCRELTRRGLTYGKSGNISVRRDAHSFFVSPTGMSYEQLAPDDIPLVNLDGRWFGRVPQVVFAADDDRAAALVPRIETAIKGYAWRNAGDYRAWPGPNSNTFIAAILDAVPEMRTALPPTAIGKDYPYDGRWLRLTPSRTGVRLTLDGYGGVTLGWVEGIEVNILGAVAGIDLRRPAVKLPGLGRFGVAPA